MKTGKVNFGLTYKPISSFKAGNSNFQMGGYYPLQTAQPAKKTDNENLFVKYSGVGALALVVATGAVMLLRGRTSNPGIARLEQKMVEMSEQLNKLQVSTTQATSQLSNGIKGILLFLSGGAGVAAGTKLINKYIDDTKTDGVNKFDENSKPVVGEKQVAKADTSVVANPSGNVVINRTVYYGTSPSEVDIWNGLTLKLDNSKFISKPTKALMREDVKNVMLGNTSMDEVKNPQIYSIAYEGWGTSVGGEADIANEIPVEFTKNGYDCIAFAPMFEALKPKEQYEQELASAKAKAVSEGKDPNAVRVPREIMHLRSEVDSKTGKIKYYYKTQKDPEFEVHKIVDTSSDGIHLQAYYAERPISKDKDGKVTKFQKVIYLYDGGEQLNLGIMPKGKNTYTQRGDEERVRMAKFMRLSYEFIQKAKDGLIKYPNSNDLIKAPDKIIAHEAWQTAPLLGELRFLSRAQEADGTISVEKGEYLRKLANNTMVIIHNLGNGYQGWIGGQYNAEIMQDYFNTTYGGYAKEIVGNGIIEDLGNKPDDKFFGSDLQRIGFIGDAVNLAHSALCTATLLGPVSKGYRNEIAKHGVAARLDKLVKARAKSGIVPMPNGVSRSDKVATRENFEKANKGIIKDVAYLVDTEADIDKLNANDVETQNRFIEAKKQNKKVVYDMLKTMASDLKAGKEAKNSLFVGSIGVHGDAKNINLDGVNENTPIYYMASRLDPQKGFETAVLAFKELYENPEKHGINPNNLPVLLTSGDADSGNQASVQIGEFIKNLKNELGAKGGRIIPVKNRMSNTGLLLAGMAGTTLMPSDFEPYGISDIKGMYAGSHVVGNAVGGMQSIPSVSRKMYDYNSEDSTDKAKANSILVANEDYKPLCLIDPNDSRIPEIRENNAQLLAEAIAQDCRLAQNSPNEIARMDINALKTNVSWDQGAFQNYLSVLKITK